MSINDGDVAALAEEVATVGGTELDVRIIPDAADDPYRWGTPSWTVRFTAPGRPPVSAWLRADLSWTDAHAQLRAAAAGARQR